MKKYVQYLLGFLLFFSVAAFADSTPAASTANSPVVFLQQTSAQMIAGLDKNKSQLKSSPKIVYNLVNQIILPHVDVDRMTGTTLGRQYWIKATPAQKQELIAELKKMVISTYAAAFQSYDGDTIAFYPLRKGAQGSSDLQVDSVVTRKSGQKISVDYNVEKVNGMWMVYDFSIENVSMTQSYHSQFASTLAQGGVPLLITQLKKHNENLPS